MAGALEITNVMKQFGAAKALNEVSLDVASGQFMSFLGPSGCGKTTLLRIIAGFETPTSGDVKLNGKSIIARPPYQRPIGMVFQNLALFPHLDVAENVRFGLAVRKQRGAEIEKKITRYLALVGLEGFEKRRIHQLSGGQKQRVALARALITEPDLLLLDEPLSALDLKLRRQLQSELKRVQVQTGTTFIFVTHDQEEAMAISDRIAVFRNGVIDQVGTPQEIYRSPTTRFVAEFVGDTNIFAVQKNGDSLALGELGITLAAPAHVAQTDTLLSLRPEHVQIAAQADNPASVPATIESIEFGGMTVRLVVQAGAGRKAIKIAQPADRSAGLAVGQNIRIALDLDAGVVVPAA
jgi:ABC-type Fe3+/spermidine/putrescine transport system ATPase subunit